MSRILNFNTFAKLYEAEGDATAQSPKTTSPPPQGKEESVGLDEEAKGLLDLIIFLISSCYGSLLSLIPEKPGYPDAVRDFTSVIAANPDQKDETIKKILSNVANAIDVKFKEANLDKMWTEAGDLGADAYAALVDQFKDDKEKADAAASILNKAITGFIEQLKSSKAEYKGANESEEYDYYDEFLDEGIGSKIVSFFTGKKGDVNNLIKQGIVVDSLLKQEAKNEKLKPEVAKLQTELDSMMAKLAKLSKSRSQRKETDDSELDKMSERMGQMPFELNKKKEEIAKASKSYSESASLFTKGQIKAAKAQGETTKLKEKFKEEAKEAKEEKDAKGDKEDGGKSDGESGPIKLEGTITYNKANSGKVNDDVAKVQQLMYDKFKDDKKVAETALFKKFAAYFKDGKPDGKFGPSTAGLVRALRAGFELDKNSNISQKFVDELTAHQMVKESYAAKYLAPFMLEAFDYDAFSKSLGGSGTGSREGSSSGPGVRPVKDWQWGGKGIEKEKEFWCSVDQQGKFGDKASNSVPFKKDVRDKDIRDFQRMALDYITKIGKDKVSDNLPKNFGEGEDKPKFEKFLNSKPDGGFGPNTMAAVRYIRGLLVKKCQSDKSFKEKVEGFGQKKDFSYRWDNPYAYTITLALANSLEQALK